MIEAWFADGCPNVSPTRTSRHARVKSPNTIANARQLLGTSVIPVIGSLKVDRTTTRRLEELFESMVETHATTTIDRNWNYLNQALQHGVRNRTIKTNPAADVLLPARRPSKQRKSFTLEQAHALMTEAIPADPRPAMWLTGLMCGLRPGELAGLRWPYVDIDSDSPPRRGRECPSRSMTATSARGMPEDRRGAADAWRCTRCSSRRCIVTADEQRLLGLYDDEGIVFCTRNGTPMTTSNLRRAFQQLCRNAGLGETGPPTSSATRSCHSSATNSTTSSRSPTSPATSTPAPPRATATPSGRACPTPSRPGTGSSDERRPSRK